MKRKKTTKTTGIEKKTTKTTGIDMNKAFFLAKEDSKPNWRVIDAKDKIVGRLATQIAKILRGKDKAIFTPHTDSGDYVVVINAEKVKFTGKKYDQKIYETYSGYIGNRKEITVKQLMQKDPTQIIEYAVRRMLPKNKLSRQILKKLKVYKGPEHPHQAQVSVKEK